MPVLSAAITVLGIAGVPKAPGGPYTGKDTGSGASRTYSADFTRLATRGTPSLTYGSFAGRAATTQNDAYSTHSLIPVVTIGDVTDVDVELTHSLIPRVTISSVVGTSKTATMSLVPRATMARGQVTSSSINKPSAPSLVPKVTLATTHVNKTFGVSHSAIPVVTLSVSVDSTFDEILSDLTAIPVVTLSSSVDDLVQPKSASHSLIPVATLAVQVNRYTASVPWDIPVVVAPRVTLTSTARIAGDVDRIDISTSPFGYIEITRA
jgi:hypothetical protein